MTSTLLPTRRTPLALLILLHQRIRTFVALAGVAFAVVLIFLQLGFYGAAEATATQVYEQLNFDLALVPADFRELNRPGSFPRDRLAQVQASQAVDWAAPLYVGFSGWRNVDQRNRRLMMILGFTPTDPVFRFPEVQEHLRDLQQADNVLVDRRSRREFGPLDVGVEGEIGTQRVKIVGQFALGGGFAADGTLVTSDATFSRIIPGWPIDRVCLGLITLKKGEDPDAVALDLNRRLPEDVRVLTRETLEARERRHWIKNTSIGIMFTFGVIVALIVGTVFVYQVISSDIHNHMREYATLKAMGYGKGFLSRIVLEEALYLSILGFVPGLAVSLALYALTRAVAVIPMFMTGQRIVFVLILTVGMCAASGFFAMRKIQHADPADLF